MLLGLSPDAVRLQVASSLMFQPWDVTPPRQLPGVMPVVVFDAMMLLSRVRVPPSLYTPPPFGALLPATVTSNSALTASYTSRQQFLDEVIIPFNARA